MEEKQRARGPSPPFGLCLSHQASQGGWRGRAGPRLRGLPFLNSCLHTGPTWAHSSLLKRTVAHQGDVLSGGSDFLVATRLSLGPVSKVTNNLKEDILRRLTYQIQWYIASGYPLQSQTMLSLPEAFLGPSVRSNSPSMHAAPLFLSIITLSPLNCHQLFNCLFLPFDSARESLGLQADQISQS